MKSLTQYLIAGALLSSAHAYGQGLLSLGQNTDYSVNVPLTFNATVGGGYDSIKYKNAPDQDVNSAFLQGGVGFVYGENHKPTQWNIGGDFGAIRYLDDAQRGDDLYYNARVAFNITSELSRRLKVSDNFYLTYEIEPDYAIGASSGIRNGQYLYGYNNFSVAYAWTERFSTTTGYTIDGIKYMDDKLTSASEDRLSNIISQQFSYKLNRQTTLTGEYRFGITNYQNQPSGSVSPDSRSHYLLVGVDQAWSPTLTGSARVGAQVYDSDRTSKTAPYAEGSINYALTRKTSVRWYGQVGFDGAELDQYSSRYTYRTGISANEQVSQKLGVNGGINYVHSSYKGNAALADGSDNELNLSAGFKYNLYQNVSLDANYSYSTISSDVDLRDYNRHHVNLGVNAKF